MKFLTLFFLLQFYSIPQANADIFGGDVLVLSQILVQTINQLAELKSILQNGKESNDLVRDINRGINDSLNLMHTISPNTNPGIYRDWGEVSDALGKAESIYGIARGDSRDYRVQHDTDQSVAEAITLNNSIYQYTSSIDQIGEAIKSESHAVSPGGAAKLTAQSLGVMLNLQNEILRTQATGLKLQAEAIAIQNRKDKDRTRQMLSSADDLDSALANQRPQFTLPRFDD